jgi:hypothetical protein
MRVLDSLRENDMIAVIAAHPFGSDRCRSGRGANIVNPVPMPPRGMCQEVGKEYEMKVPTGEGLANHPDPE